MGLYRAPTSVVGQADCVWVVGTTGHNWEDVMQQQNMPVTFTLITLGLMALLFALAAMGAY